METDWKKKYEEALNKARETHGTVAAGRDFLAEIFPELCESEDERIRRHLIDIVETYWGKTNDPGKAEDLAWLEKQKDTPMPEDSVIFQKGVAEGRRLEREEQKPEWSDEDEKKIHFLSRLIEFQVKDDEYIFGDGSRMISKQEAIEMLQSLRPKPHWRPSEEQMKVFFKATPVNLMPEELLIYQSLYDDLTKLL